MAYLTVYLGLGIGTIGQLVFERMLISTGKTVYSMISQAIGAILNLILDPVLIFTAGMGITGAAVVGFALMLRFYRKDIKIAIGERSCVC